ncbi:MAG TPA: hypothetical protein ENI68_11735 [Gammaproteobacteria bacterium]|nr:hypothetical protein [Gammaproteobacteria bacterium]
MTLFATHAITGHKNQKGIVLVVALLILIVMTVLSVSMLSSSMLEERMASNLQSQNTTFQAAESCIRTTLQPANEVSRQNAALALDINPNTIVTPIKCTFDNTTIPAQVDFSAPPPGGMISGFTTGGVVKAYPMALSGTSSLVSGTSSTVQEVIQQIGPP